MQRYFVDAGHLQADTVYITGDDARHLQQVMRARPGERVIVADGSGQEAVVRLVALDKDRATAEVEQRSASAGEPHVRVLIAQALPKGDKLEIVIQKGTEVGATGFLPFVSERTIVQYDAKKEAKRLERWSKIAKEAAEQAHRGIVPQVGQVADWRAMLAEVKQADAAYICYERPTGAGLRARLSELRRRLAISPSPPPTIALIVGPEGGFSEREIREAEEAGCVSVTLGARILRTETAALVGLSCVLYEFGEMGV